MVGVPVASMDWCDTLFDMKAQTLKRMSFALRRSSMRAMDLLTPPSCPVTGELMAQNNQLSAAGWRALQFIDDPCCAQCGVPFPVDYGPEILCGSCIAAPPDFDRARAAIVYDDAGHKLVVSFKHSDRTDLAAMLGQWMARAGRSLISSASMIAPIPLHPRRLLARRYNQSALLAEVIAQQASARFTPDLLVRRRATPPQQKLSASARLRNVSGAFVTRKFGRNRVDGAHIVLVDDVLTTGATLSSAAKALKKAGAAQVDAIVLSRVVKNSAGL